MINKRGRKPSSRELEKAKNAVGDEEVTRMTFYLPLKDKDALELLALKRRTNGCSELLREIVSDFLAKVKD